MKYRKFGRTGVEVSSQCLGAMMFGVIGNPDHDACERMIGRALDAGINFIDTADIYSRGESEEIVGRAVKGRRDDVVIATKCFNQMGDDRNQRGGSRRWIMKAAEDSLRRLGTDYLDLFQVHRHDWDTDLEETLGALTDLVRQGKVRYIGSSTFPADWIVEAQWAAQRRGSERFVSEQPQYSIFARSVEQSVLPTCLRHNIGVIPWSPLSGGWLTGKYRRGQAEPASSRYAAGSVFARGRTISADPASEDRYDAVEELSKIAATAGLSLTHLALAFVDRHPAITSTIIGPKTIEQLDDVLAAVDVVLDDATLDAIDQVVRPGTDLAGVFHMTGDPSLRPELRRRAAERS
ncbi:aldo/keto reductase [Frankia sp. AgB1.9]|uniref:aldo/keto reductase n=1 Tax=unclassified Frankia TaxID=2632575 RepID=UPI001931D326|nr:MULTISPECIES: aldo/keto reductase [unclassified Frankia]MBL7488580.1 aldo/keto reductase [Frankia sp. AgW1.1]MBL7550614.1 aldo/keto reductase [Frankia sp. AgB1.9]MBL7619793.1 aldo/keto reductase [Frankia sp. AgB1.8]